MNFLQIITNAIKTIQKLLIIKKSIKYVITSLTIFIYKIIQKKLFFIIYKHQLQLSQIEQLLKQSIFKKTLFKSINMIKSLIFY
ncbi:unnamed protein product [Paramecium sonneborni]|uniref:Uncharacterized protein n=1 Tax=Paramecium sonneborni TaxID=65129 RepID=A0A8S1PE59_9CILI|nr:unnamed protein product [Paramecium sonneborni]